MATCHVAHGMQAKSYLHYGALVVDSQLAWSALSCGWEPAMGGSRGRPAGHVGNGAGVVGLVGAECAVFTPSAQPHGGWRQCVVGTRKTRAAGRAGAGRHYQQGASAGVPPA